MSGDALAARGLSVRWRLTIVYTAVAVASAAVLLAGIYVLVRLQQHRRVFFGDVEPTTTQLPGPSSGPLTGETPDGNLLVRRAIIDAQESAVDTTLRDLLIWSALGLLLMGVVSVLVGWLFAGRALRPVHVITSRARRISAHSLDERLAVEGPRDELREMAETFDSLLDRIQHAFESERRLVATMSHELRTPLANQRAVLDVTLADPTAGPAELRAAAQTARAQAERAERTVEALLSLARIEAGAEPVPAVPVDLAALAAEEAAIARADAGDLAWEGVLDAAETAGSQELLRRAVANLLQNAVRHNRPGGWVRVETSTGSDGAEIVVSNSGALLDAAAVPALTLPFRRGAGDRTGSSRGAGLGLTIVQAVADAHGGRLTLTPLADGGLRAALLLPTTNPSGIEKQHALTRP